tara:strand:- start:37 stop:243 length:207 start_codon:yes stop_codon:yes gene_type:complete
VFGLKNVLFVGKLYVRVVIIDHHIFRRLEWQWIWIEIINHWNFKNILVESLQKSIFASALNGGCSSVG